VIGRTSSFAFKGKNMDLKVIGDQLKVSYILEGSVRKSGNKLRVTAQLIKVSDGFHLYSEKFDRELEDIFDIQDEISLAILNAIKIKLLGEEKEAILSKGTDNLEAYQLYLKGLFHFNRPSPESFLKAIEYYKDAIKTDPEYALAYAGLANCYNDSYVFNWLPREQSLPQAIEAARNALQLDDKLAESHIAVGRLKLWADWDFTGAGVELEKGSRLNPNSVEGLRQLGILNILMGNRLQAHTYLNKADILDPFSLLNLFYIASYYRIDRDFDKEVEYARRQIELVPNFYGGHIQLVSVYFKENRFEEWINTLELANKLTGYGDLLTLSTLGAAYARTGEKMKAQEVLEIMKKIRGTQNMGNHHFGFLHAAMGEFEQAFEYFDKAISLHEGFMFYMKSFCQDYAPDFIKDPRFKKLIERMGIPIHQE
jgi:serine/threonine-protein kinase